jgi:hypothetical protein
VTDLKQRVEGKVIQKYTYITAWAGNGNLYNLIRCNNETYQREVVASFDELSKRENAALSLKCAHFLNEEESARDSI